MKRFYCTICKRVKRVRKFPIVIQEANSEAPENRKGVCNWHTAAGRQSIRSNAYRKVAQ